MKAQGPKDGNGIPVLQYKKKKQPQQRSFRPPKSWAVEPLTERELYRRQNGICFYCQTPLFPAPWSRSYAQGWTRDHFFPRSHGNEALAANMVLACKACNSGKSDDAPTVKEMKRFQWLYSGENLASVFGKGACR